MSRMRASVVCVLSSFFVTGWMGCAANMVSVSEPAVQTVVKPEYEIQFEPIKQVGTAFSIFRLTIKNQTDASLRIDWHRTPYLFKGERHGMFVSKDSEPGNVRDRTKRYEAIEPGATYTKDIAPLELVAYAYTKYNQEIDTAPFSAGPIPAGKSGIILRLRHKDKDFNERIEVEITDRESKDL